MSDYIAVNGDTFESISRKKYGFESEALRLVKANPGVVEPIPPGVSIVIPPLPEAPTDLIADTLTAGENEVAILIGGKRFRFWETVEINRSLDTFDTVSITAPFEPGNGEFREVFRPFTYKPLKVFVGGAPLFSGTMVNVDPSVEKERSMVIASGYSLPGVLNDCTPPSSAYPLEFNGENLKGIATAVCSPFGLSVVFDSDPGPVFERENLLPGKKAFAFLVDLAKQRGLIMSNTPSGALRFFKSEGTTVPVAALKTGESPLLSVTPSFNPQDYYSSITGITPMYVGGLGGEKFTERNEHLKNVLRPLTFSPEDTVNADAGFAAKAKLGRMFGAAASYSVAVASWRAPTGALWQPGDTLTLEAPEAMVYGVNELIIRSAVFVKTVKGEAVSLELVLPGAFGGQIPEVLPWEG